MNSEEELALARKGVEPYASKYGYVVTVTKKKKEKTASEKVYSLVHKQFAIVAVSMIAFVAIILFGDKIKGGVISGIVNGVLPFAIILFIMFLIVKTNKNAGITKDMERKFNKFMKNND